MSAPIKWLCQPCGHKHGTKSAEPGFFGRCSLCQIVTKVARDYKFGYKGGSAYNEVVVDIGADSADTMFNKKGETPWTA